IFLAPGKSSLNRLLPKLFLLSLFRFFTIWVSPVVWGLFADSFLQQVSQMVHSIFNKCVQDSGIHSIQ
ncbi:MAG: hypothetical protein WBJ50_05355, partial [Smithellaceae bacterium]